jgi:hypothetical protein
MSLSRIQRSTRHRRLSRKPKAHFRQKWPEVEKPRMERPLLWRGLFLCGETAFKLIGARRDPSTTQVLHFVRTCFAQDDKGMGFGNIPQWHTRPSLRSGRGADEGVRPYTKLAVGHCGFVG